MWRWRQFVSPALGWSLPKRWRVGETFADKMKSNIWLGQQENFSRLKYQRIKFHWQYLDLQFTFLSLNKWQCLELGEDFPDTTRILSHPRRFTRDRFNIVSYYPWSLDIVIRRMCRSLDRAGLHFRHGPLFVGVCNLKHKLSEWKTSTYSGRSNREVTIWMKNQYLFVM
jgi:hypothetical protein